MRLLFGKINHAAGCGGRFQDARPMANPAGLVLGDLKAIKCLFCQLLHTDIVSFKRDNGRWQKESLRRRCDKPRIDDKPTKFRPMNRTLSFLFQLFLCQVLTAQLVRPLSGGEKAPNHQLDFSENDLAKMPEILREMNARWPQRRIDPRSRDYAILKYLAKKPDLARGAVNELIALADLLEPKPLTTESIENKLSLSPAGYVLVAIGDPAMIPTGRWLTAHFDQASDTREVLLQVRNSIRSKRLVLFKKQLDEKGEAAQERKKKKH